MGWVAAAVGIGTALFGGSAAKKQKKVEKKKAQLTYEDNLEKIRRREYTQDQTLGATKALSETAGVLHRTGTTPVSYMREMSDAFKREIDWMKEYAERAKKLGMESANVQFKANTINAIASGISVGASVYGMGGGGGGGGGG